MNAADVIVVGAGSSGCALAAGLSDDPRRTVLLLEGGPARPSAGGRLPQDALATPGLGSPGAIPGDRLLRYAGTSDGRAIPVVRARGVGGSSVVNGAFWLRGLPEDYDGWGSPRWSAEVVMGIFARMEGSAFPVRRSAPAAWWPFHRAFSAGARALGIADKPDMNAPDGDGVGPFPRNADATHRIGADRAYLAGALRRGNLRVRTDAEVTSLRLDGRRVAGVVLADGTSLDAREIVLCAGAIETPRLLLRSGIGPAGALTRAGIAVRHVLDGVGENLRDHPAVVVAADLQRPHPRPRNGEVHQVVMAYTAPGSALRNDLQMVPAYPAGDGGPDREVRVVCGLQRPLARGRLVLGPGPDHPVRLDFGFLAADEDRRRLVEAVRRCVRLLDTGAARAIAPARARVPPGVMADDELAEAWVADHLSSFFHSCGTARMGSATDPLAVVDDHGRVHGLDGLWVGDLSIVVDNVRANPNATASMIGERIAELFTNADTITNIRTT